MPNSFRDDEGSTDAQVIIFVIDCVDTLLFVKAMGKRPQPNKGLFEEMSGIQT